VSTQPGDPGVSIIAGEAEAEAELDSAAVLDSRDAGGKIVRGGAMRTAGYVGGLLLGLISTPLVVRHLGVVDFGRYATVSSLMFIVTGLTEGGLAALGMREYSTLDPAGRATLVRNLLGLRIALTFVAAVIAAGFAVLAGYTSVMVAGTIVLSGALLATSYWHTLNIPLQTELRLGWISGIEFLRQALTAVLMVALVIVGASLFPFFVVAPVTAVIAAGVTVAISRREVPKTPAFAPAEWVKLLRQTVLYAAATALGVLYFQLAMVLTSLSAGEHQTGFFAVAFRITELFNGVPWLLTTSAFPLVARAALNDRERLRYALQRMFDVALVVGVLFSLAIVTGARFAINVVAGAGHEPSIDALHVLGLAAPATFLVATWAYALLALRRHRALLVSNGVAVVVMTVLVLVLASSHGAKGAAIAAVSTEYVLATAYGIALMRPHPDMRVSPHVVPRVLASAAIAVAPVLLLQPPSVVAAIIAVAVYSGAALLLRAVPREVIEAFEHLIPGRRR
jgi:O-antigen/teichoic acid export membrane protein